MPWSHCTRGLLATSIQSYTTYNHLRPLRSVGKYLHILDGRQCTPGPRLDLAGRTQLYLENAVMARQAPGEDAGASSRPRWVLAETSAKSRRPRSDLAVGPPRAPAVLAASSKKV